MIEKHALNNTELQVTKYKNSNEGFGLFGSQDSLKIKACCAASRIGVLNRVSTLSMVLKSVDLTICRINRQLLFQFNVLRLILGMIDCQLLLSFLPLFGQATNAMNNEFFK
jgi:hypothetical protein